MSRARDFADLAGSADAGGITGRNLVINGAYQIYQRSSSATAAAGSYETADRWINFELTDGAYTTEQSTDHPLGSGYSHKAQVTTADTSIGATQFAYIVQKIEAQNLQHLLYGTSSAKSLTLSFYVKSNKTGTYGVNLYKTDSTGYLFVKEYTINSANTWEKKTITISPTAGSTSFITASAGAIANDNGSGLEVGFNLAWGSNFTGGTSDSWSVASNGHYATTNQVNWMDSTSNNFYLAEVQLEVGEQATPFEHRSFADELQRCQRYYAVKGNTEGSGKYFGQTLQVWNTSSVYGIIAQYPATMRTVPTVSQSGTFGAYTATSGAGYFSTSIENFFGTSEAWGTGGWSGSGLVVGDASVMFANAGAELRADAEL
jgi:hypothetical protein